MSDGVEPGLSADRIRALVSPYLPASAEVPADLYLQLERYLAQLLRWNARMNLTSIRMPEEMVDRHFGESLFAGAALEGRLARGASLLDVGSGAGFPGLPIKLLRPDLWVTLVESQGKKASFLRETVRTLELDVEVISARLETMDPSRHFAGVSLRAVDKMKEMMPIARGRVAPGGWLIVLSGGDAPLGAETLGAETLPLPRRIDASLTLLQRGSDSAALP